MQKHTSGKLTDNLIHLMVTTIALSDLLHQEKEEEQEVSFLTSNQLVETIFEGKYTVR